MDGSFARNLPVGRIMIFAAIGVIATALVSIGGAGWLIWFAINHVSIH